MNKDNEFDKRMELYRGRIPNHIRDALIETTDTLDFCYSAVKSVFGDQATPENALALCNIVVTRYLSTPQLDNPSQPHTH